MLLRCDADVLRKFPPSELLTLAAIVNVKQASFLPQSMANIS